ncbi:hypothetical protein MVEN_01607000 [Mycena venus]|uniref:Uncharacterized protein n=1 Tax=Mycena venus TaxID=2733690 RepID=A0A8H7CSH9_9AGAR|nr:hypothetical protein MVEN_01607000 [Mycena venus]
MSTSSSHAAAPNPSQSAGPTLRPYRPTQSSTSDWLTPLLLNAKALAAGAEIVPFPYVKGVFGSVVLLLETVDKVKRNRDSMRELCDETMDIITLLRDQIISHEDAEAIKFKGHCKDLEECVTVYIS